MIMENDNYGLIATQPADFLGEGIEQQIQAHSQTHELRYTKIKGLNSAYRSYVLHGIDIPALTNADLHIGSIPQKELADVLNETLNTKTLPWEIRIIRQNVEQNHWDIFFKRS